LLIAPAGGGCCFARSPMIAPSRTSTDPTIKG
jgi:hypothetical protein